MVVDICEGSYTITRTWSLVDNCDNAAADQVQTITVLDNTPPAFFRVASDQSVQCDGQGNTTEYQEWLNTFAGAKATDNCSGQLNWSYDVISTTDDCGLTSRTLVSFTVTDDCGNSSSSSALFTIIDLIAPTIDTEASDLQVECGPNNDQELQAWLDNGGGAVASDICGGVTWSYEITASTDDCGETGSTTATFTATDDCGNRSATTSATFTIVDNTAPSIDIAAADETVECGANNEQQYLDWLTANGNASASDLCGEVSWSNQITSSTDDCGNTGSTTVIFTATDECNNSSSTTATFTIVDNTDPTIDIAAADQTVECEAGGDTCEYTFQGFDTFGDGWNGALIDILVNDVVVIDDYGFTDGYDGPIVGFTVSNGDVISAVYNSTGVWPAELSYNILNSTGDVVGSGTSNDLADLSAECPAGNQGQLDAWLASNGGAEASDSCGSIVWSNNFSELDDGCGHTGSATVTFTATDDCGNASTTTATFTIVDTTDPVVTDATDKTVECTSEGTCIYYIQLFDSFGDGWQGDVLDVLVNGEVVLDDLTLADLFNGEEPVDGEHDPIPFPVVTGDIVITVSIAGDYPSEPSWIIFDPNMNAVAEGDNSQQVDITADCTGGSNEEQLEAWLASNGGATASDTCGEVTWSNDFIALSDECGHTGSATVTFTATDECNNSSSTTATFTIIDTIAPAIDTEAEDLAVECDGNGNVDDFRAWLDANGGAEVSDLCGEITWTNNCDNPWQGFMNVFDFQDNFQFGGGWGVPDLVTIVEDNNTSLTLKPNRINVAQDDTYWLNPDGSGNKVMEAITLAADDALLGQAFSFNGSVSSNTLDPNYTSYAFVRIFSADYSSFDEFTAPLNEGPFSIVIDGTIAPEGGHIQYGFIVKGVNVNPSAAYDAAYDALGSIQVQAAECVLTDACGATGSRTVTFTATDECGNSASTTATFTIEAEPIVVSAPENVDASACDYADQEALTAAYNEWLAEFTIASGGCIATGDFTTAPPAGVDYHQGADITLTYTATDGCSSDSATATFSVTPPPAADQLDDVVACDSYKLPELSPGNTYWTGPGRNGDLLNEGDTITSSQTLYIYAVSDNNENCFDESSFNITINFAVADQLQDVEVCESYTLPGLSDGNAYWTGTNGSGTQLFPGDVISSDQAIFIYAQSNTVPVCYAENRFTVTILDTPDVTDNVFVCAGDEYYWELSDESYYIEASPVTITLTNENGCEYHATLIIEEYKAFDIIETVEHVSCFGEADASISVEVDGGTPPYTYTWTGPGDFSADTDTVTNVAAGTYTVFVEDANGCVNKRDIMVESPSQIQITSTVTPTTGDSDTGAITIDTTTGGAGEYNYNWSGDGEFTATTRDLSGLDDGFYLLQITDANDCAEYFEFEVTQQAPGVQVSLRAMLSGPYDSNTGLMKDDLRSIGELPTVSPYIDEAITDASVFNTTGSNAIIDWVWIELRDSGDATSVITSKSALIQADGDVVETDGVTPVSFDTTQADYYIMIAHRNHLGVLTADPISLTYGDNPVVDLSTDITKVFGGVNGAWIMTDSRIALYSGDCNGDGQIQNSDRSDIQLVLGTGGFLYGDIDMNGQVQNSDIQIKVNPNIGKGIQNGASRAMDLSLFAKRRTSN